MSKMTSTIDFENPSTFPIDLRLRSCDPDFQNWVKSQACSNNKLQNYGLDMFLKDLRIENHSIVREFLRGNKDNTRVILYHATRILDEKDFWENGLVTDARRGGLGDKRIKKLLVVLGFSDDQIREILSRVYGYWERDNMTDSVHFFSIEQQLYDKSIDLDLYASNLGGEVLRSAIEDIAAQEGKQILSQEPYKLLWTKGKPCTIKFSCKLSDICETDQEKITAMMTKYFIAKELYKSEYYLGFTGRTDGPVPPSGIIKIEEIGDFSKIEQLHNA